MVALNIVIAGGGVVGTSIAYFLALRDVPVTLVDPNGIAPAASGKAGGFLAKDWRDGTPLEEMHRLGFRLHEELANSKDLGGPSTVDYRRLSCAAVAVDENAIVKKPPSKKLQGVEWVDKGVIGTVPMGDEETIAQVHPRKFCQALWEATTKKVDSKLHQGRIVNAVVDENESMKAVELEDGEVLPADALVIACGPWTHEANNWFDKPRIPLITGVKCHSILVKSPKVLSQAVFFQSDGSLGDGDLEVYPRPDGDCYVNGFPDEMTVVSEPPGEESLDERYLQLLQDAMDQTTSELGKAHTEQACYWPETPDGLPLLGEIPGVKGAFVAAGHSVWGINQGPSTGKAMAELILDGEATSLDISRFSLDRFYGT